jgi:hypothetical protein
MLCYLGNRVAQPPPPKAKERKSWRVFSKFGDKIATTPLQKDYYKNLRVILSNSLNRLIFLFLDLLLIGLLFYFLSISFNQATNIVGQLVLLLFFLALLYVPVTYLWRSSIQLNFETSLNSSIYDVDKTLEKP